MNRKMAMPWWGWLSWILVIVLGVVTYFHLPAEVPSHVNSVGKPALFISRLFAVLYEPAIMLVIMILWNVLWRIDPKKRNYESFWSTYRYIGGVIVVCVSLIYLTVLGHLLHIGSMRFALTAYGIMFMLIGNVLPRLQPPELVDWDSDTLDPIERRELGSDPSVWRATWHPDGYSNHSSCLGFAHQ